MLRVLVGGVTSSSSVTILNIQADVKQGDGDDSASSDGNILVTSESKHWHDALSSYRSSSPSTPRPHSATEVGKIKLSRGPMAVWHNLWYSGNLVQWNLVIKRSDIL